MVRALAVIAAAISCVAILTGCTRKEEAAPVASSTAVAVPVRAAGPTPVTFKFSSVAVTTSGAHILRLGFSIKNASKDPVQCDPTLFQIQLSDGTTIGADGSANFVCNPDSIDPNASGQSVMYFNLTSAYSGPIVLTLTVNDKVIGRGTTALK